MNTTEIAQIVAEVIRRLQAAAEVAPTGSAGASPSQEGPQQPTTSLASLGGTSGLAVSFSKTKQRVDAPRSGRPDPSSDVLDSQDRVLTLSTLDGKLEGLRRLVVHRKAIVTPALREELSRRGIELDRGGVKGIQQASAVVSIVRFDAERAPSLHGLGLAEDVTMKSAAAMTNTVAAQLESKDRLVMVLTRQTSLALCALNRHTRIRAAQATNVESVRIAARAIAANVLVIDPGHLGRVQFSALLRAFENEGVRNLNTELQELL